MTIFTKTLLDDTTIKRDGTILLRFEKQAINGDSVISSEWHRTALAPGCDAEGTLDQNSQHLVELGYTAISADDKAQILQLVAARQTPDVVAAYKSAQEVQP